MNDLKRQLLTGWHLARWIRLALGGILLVQAVAAGEYFFGAIALLLLYQAATNTGCCGPAGCALPTTNTSKQDEKPGSHKSA